jgi:peptide/nickel transport system permease protein
VTAYLIRRLFQSIVVLFGVIFIAFFLQHLIPGGAAAAAVLGNKATPRAIAIWNHENGYDRPYLVQYVNYIWNVVHLKFGFSSIQNQEIWPLIRAHMSHTISLILASQILVFLVALPLGIAQAQRRNTRFDYFATGFSFLLYATPAFLLGELLLSLFALHWHFFPVAINSTAGPWSVFTDPRQFVLPVLTLSAISIGGLSRYQRSSLLDTLTQDYIRTAKAKGAGRIRVLYRHGLRNSILRSSRSSDSRSRASSAAR